MLRIEQKISVFKTNPLRAVAEAENVVRTPIQRERLTCTSRYVLVPINDCTLHGSRETSPTSGRLPGERYCLNLSAAGLLHAQNIHLPVLVPTAASPSFHCRIPGNIVITLLPSFLRKC